MIIPYRTRQVFKRIALAALAVLLVLALIWSIWFIWLKRYVVYTSDGAKLDFSLGTFTQGQVAEEPLPGETVSIYYNEGDNLVQTSTELTQMTGYYIEIGAMQEDMEAVISQVRQLAAGTPVMVDVKNIYGSFYYSCACGNPVNDADLCEGYTYHEETNEITLDYMESTEEMVTTIRIVQVSEDVLELDFNGEIRTFEREMRLVT